jgi:hypothetical protein
MEYLVFPFGKYKGVALTELPSTYIVLALEKFELPVELHVELTRILFGRFKVYSQSLDSIKSNLEAWQKQLSDNVLKYENHG